MNPKNELDHKIEELKEKAKKNPDIDWGEIEKAVEFGRKAHDGKCRKNGGPYFIHPVRVATKALDYDLGTIPIITSLLHDIVEDTGYSLRDIKDLFGETVAENVEALTKVRSSKKTTLLKILKLGNIDCRVILIKLIDRLDNMSDLEVLPRQRQREICRETAAVFSEIAHNLGLTEIEEELQNLVFKKLYPRTYGRISKELTRFCNDRNFASQEILKAVKKAISDDLLLKCSPQYVKPSSFLYDRGETVKILEYITIVTKEPIDCYKVLGQLHTAFRSVPLTIRDYISNPKANGWKGLTTIVIVKGERVTLNIVTQKFQEKNRFGIITLINEGTYQSEDYKKGLKLFFEVATEPVRMEEVLRYRKSKPIQVFTPQGLVVELGYGATITDFAFSVHTDLGLKCSGGIINSVRYPREKILEEGMTVKVVTSDHVSPDRTWLNNVVMPKSRLHITKICNKSDQKSRTKRAGVVKKKITIEKKSDKK